jgi:cell division protein FtsL
MMRKSAILVAVIVLLAVGCLFANNYHHRQIRRQLQIAYSSVSTAEDYYQNGAFPEADLAARGCLDALDSESLNLAEAQAAKALREWLSSLESLVSSHSIETSVLRAGIADQAAAKAEKAMSGFRK